MHRYPPDDPRYHDRFQAAVELLKMWRNLVQEGPGTPRCVILPGPALNTLVGWTDSFLDHPANVPEYGDVAKT